MCETGERERAREERGEREVEIKIISKMELTMENIGNLHGVSHSHQTGDLMNSPHHARQSLASHRNLVSHGRSAMVSSMASILEGAGEYRTDHALSGPLHPAMTMSCDSGMTMSSTYTDRKSVV